MIFNNVQANSLAATIKYAKENVRRGTQNGSTIDGRVNHSILSELFSNEHIGVMLIHGD